MLPKEIADWQVNGFASVRRWARSIGYRIAMHSEESAAKVEGKTTSPRNWAFYYASLIKRGCLRSGCRPCQVDELVEGIRLIIQQRGAVAWRWRPRCQSAVWRNLTRACKRVAVQALKLVPPITPPS